MTKPNFLAVTTALLFSALPIQSVAAKLGYVDAVKLVETAPQGQQAMKKLEQEFGEREQTLLELRDKAIKLDDELQKNSLVMSEEDKAEKARELREMQRDLQRQQRELQEDYNLRRNEELAKLQKVVSKAVIDIAKEEQYDLIVQQAVWYSPEIDMTDKVLKRLSDTFNK